VIPSLSGPGRQPAPRIERDVLSTRLDSEEDPSERSSAVAPEPAEGTPSSLAAPEQLAALSSRLTELEKAAGQLPELLSRLSDLEAAVGQTFSALRREGGIPPFPPRALQIRVVGSYVPLFHESAFSICDDLDALLSGVGRSLGDFKRILDWGCGCGRMTRAFRTRLPSTQLHATDIDPEAIDWLSRNYRQFAEYRLALTIRRPPTPTACSTSSSG